MTVLAQSKPHAREQGAEKFLFTGTDPYSGMRAKGPHALECPPQEFLKQTSAAQNYRRDPSPEFSRRHLTFVTRPTGLPLLYRPASAGP